MKKSAIIKGIMVLYLLAMAGFYGCNQGGEQKSEENATQEMHEHDHDHDHDHEDEDEDEDEAMDTDDENAEAAVYYCPMKCEGDKTYSQPGKCPVCGMDLVLLEEDNE